MSLLIPQLLLHTIERTCLAAWPQEACGLLVGTDGAGQGWRVTRIFPAANLFPYGHDRFELDPAVRIRVERMLRHLNGAERVVGHYHSHPNGIPVPSATDAAMVYEPELVWLIVGTDQQGGADSRAYGWQEGQGGFGPVHLQKIIGCL